MASTASQLGITASSVPVAIVSLVSLFAENTGMATVSFSIPQILVVALPASLRGVLLAALWSIHRGKDRDDDPAFQKCLAGPEFTQGVYDQSTTLIDQRFPASS